MGESTPICRCRVLYLGSAVPRQSKDGLQGIQEPLRSLYPSEGAAGARGIDSWLSVWSNGILLENVDENRKQVTRFFPIDSLHYCAAVRHVLVPERSRSDPEPKFLPLDSPFAKAPVRGQKHPPLFAAILRRTSGIKVLECHAFICKREAAANALVRCCFHAYADSSYARHQSGSTDGSICGTLGAPVGWGSRAGSTATIDTLGRQRHDEGAAYASSAELAADDTGSLYNGDENHKVWGGSVDRLDELDGDIYSGGGGSTLGRPARARQMSAPAPPPPPPVKELKEQERRRKQMQQQQYMQQQQQQQMMMQQQQQEMRRGNMPLSRGSRPAPGQQQLMRAPPVLLYHTAPPQRHFHTFSHRSRGQLMMPPQQQFRPQHPQQYMQTIQPPPQQYPQYATLQAPKLAKKKQRNGKNPVPMAPMVAPLFAYPPTIDRSLAAVSRKLALSQAEGLDILGQQQNGQNGADSPNGTGIYRRKGHLNERAFSYSIRQEHRSRSHGSLASLQFAPQSPVGSPGAVPQQQEDVKKEREIMQLVAGLDLNGLPNGHHHHSPGGSGMVNGNGGGSSSGMNGHQMVNGNRGLPPPQPPLASLGVYGKARR